MTTRREVKEWVRPLIESHPTMVQVDRLLAFKPVGHVLRGLRFLGGSSRYSPNPHWVLSPLFMAPGLISQFGRDIPVGHSDWPGFREVFEERTSECIAKYLAPHETIDEFYALARETEAFFFGDLRGFPSEHAIVLAALGRFEEAEELLVPSVDRLQATGQARIDLQRAVLEKRIKKRPGDVILSDGEDYLRMAETCRQLIAALRIRDAAAVAALLRSWEQKNVTWWGVEQYWQPTPFPFEERRARDSRIRAV